MSERTYTVQLKGKTVKVTSRDLAMFRDMYVEAELASRMSELTLLWQINEALRIWV